MKKPFTIKIGPQTLTIPEQDLKRSKQGIVDFSESFRISWLKQNHPDKLAAYQKQNQQFNTQFHKTPKPNTKKTSHITLQPITANSTPHHRSSVTGRRQSLIKKFKLICRNKKTKPTPIAQTTYLNMHGIQEFYGTDKEYRNIPAYSNSRLTEIKNQLMNIHRPKPYKAFGMGSIVHQLILEPHLATITDYAFLTPAVKRDIIGMVLAAKEHPSIRPLLTHYQKEQIVTWTEPTTGLPCKSKVDLLLPQKKAADLKTTRARTLQEFQQSVFKYEYDRQAAFYLDGANVKKFTFFGIQKVAPYQVFKLTYTLRNKTIKEGRRKHRFILQKAKALNLQPRI